MAKSLEPLSIWYSYGAVPVHTGKYDSDIVCTGTRAVEAAADTAAAVQTTKSGAVREHWRQQRRSEMLIRQQQKRMGVVRERWRQQRCNEKRRLQQQPATNDESATRAVEAAAAQRKADTAAAAKDRSGT